MKEGFFKNKKKLFILLGCIIIVVGCVLGRKAYFHHKQRAHITSKRCIPNVVHDGIDVSHHQGELDWKHLGKDPNIKFAYVKASEGTTWRDNYFNHNVTEAQKHGVKVGAYHMLSLTSSPETQVENFCRMVEGKNLDLIPAIDIEEKLTKHKNHKKLTQYTIRVSELLTKRFGRKPLIYTSVDVYNNYLHPQFENHYLWIASYSKRCPLLKGKTHVNIWQYSQYGRIPNYNKIIDLNCFVNGMTVDKLELK